MNDVFDAATAKATLENTLSSVLAEMAFMDCVPAPAGTALAPDYFTHCVAIDALKPSSFRIELRVPESLRGKMLGLLFDPSGVQADEPVASEADLLLEILNVLAGNFISAYFGEAESPKLELPRYLYFNDLDDGKAVTQSLMSAEGDFINIALHSIRYRY